MYGICLRCRLLRQYVSQTSTSVSGSSLIRTCSLALFGHYTSISSETSTTNSGGKNVIALRSKKGKSKTGFAKEFIDYRVVRARGGKGGDGCISLSQIFGNAAAGPDGGDGGHGGHVIFQADENVRGLSHVTKVIEAKNGERGYGKDCNGRCAEHTVVNVPVGTVIKNGESGRIIGDLNEPGMMFVGARGGAGGHGNHFFVSDTDTIPKVAECGAVGEYLTYILELSYMAHFGLLGFPNAGKSTLLRAITRANPKIASYPFTTLKPHLGVVQYSDQEQIKVADLPGLIEGSHKNKGLGITFLRHAERCLGLLVLLDMSEPEPWTCLKVLRNEVLKFSTQLITRPQIIVANKMDMPNSSDNLEELLKILKKEGENETIVSISAKHGQNLTELLVQMRVVYDKTLTHRQKEEEELASNSSL